MRETSETKTKSNVRPIKKGGYSHKKLDIRKKQRQHDADDRQMQYDALTTQEKIAHVKSHRGESKKQIVKLQAILDAQVKSQAKVAPKVDAPKVEKATPKKNTKNKKG